MGHIFLKTAALSFTGYAIYRVVENSAPTIEITRQAFAAPHPQRGVTFSPLNPVMHQVQLWESSDGTTLDTLRSQIDIDASINSELMVTNFNIVVDRGNAGLVVGDTGDPVAGTNQYLDARMKDQLFVIVERGFGPFRPDEYLDESSDLASGYGGFSLLGTEKFDHNDTFFITIYGLTVIETEPPANELDVVIESDSVTIDATYFGKLVIANGGGNLQTLTFPLFSTFPDKTRMSFSSQYGTYKYLKLQFGVGDSIRFNDATKNAIYLSRDERIDFIFKTGSVCYVINYNGRARERGKIYGDYLVRTGTVQADGTEYTKAQLEGFYDWLVNDAPSNIKCTYTDWAASTVLDNGDTVFLRNGLFAVDLVGEKFKMPFVEGMFERYLLSEDTTRTPNSAGGYQDDEAKYTYTKTTGTGGTDQGDLTTNVGYQGADPSVAQFRNKIITTGEETRPKNIGKIPLVVL